MKKFKLSIRMAVLSLMAVSVLMVTAIIMYVTISKFNAKLLESSIDNMEGVVQNCRDEVSRSVMRAQEASDLLVSNKSFIDALEYTGTDEVEVYSSILKIKSDTSAIRNYSGGRDYGYYGCFFVDSDMPIAKHLEPYNNKQLVPDTMFLYNSIGLEKKSWYTDFIKSGSPIYIFQDEEMPECVFYAQRLRKVADANGREIGISLIGINFQNILRNYGRATGQNAAYIMILGSDGKLIATNSEDVTDDIIKFAGNYRNKGVKSGEMESVTIDSSQYYAGIYDMDFGLSLVAVVSREDVFITIQETTRDVYLLVLMLLLIMLILTVVVSGVIVRPIKHLSDYMKDGPESPTVADTLISSRVTEIDNLYKAYNSMTERISVLLDTAETLGEQKKETEFRMLQTQINPHYLYNALDSISWMALRKGDEDISDMASALADSFRYNARTSEMIIELDGEIEFIRNYIKLQEKFRNTQFNLQIDVSEEVSKLQVPKFMLQPLVENAIIHGLKRDDTLAIKISASVNDGILEIRTEDNGTGYNADALNSYLGGDKSVFDTEKIGIVNIHKRLKNKYGDKAGLRYTSNAGGGLTAIIALPLAESEHPVLPGCNDFDAIERREGK